jgi:hypothetical protein
MKGKNLLNIVNIYRFVELFGNTRQLFARYPDFQFGFQIKSTRRFDAESRNTFVGNRFVLGFASGDSLDINQYQTLVCKNECVAD